MVLNVADAFAAADGMLLGVARNQLLYITTAMHDKLARRQADESTIDERFCRGDWGAPKK
jgi:hypothetical protein